MCPVEESFLSLTPALPQLHLFEREIHEQTGIIPEGHPWLKPVRFPQSVPSSPIGVTNYFRIEGEEIHEVAVGPVHAGVIEPGHFRFQCHGELVHHLEISLGYQHRGIEEALAGGPHPRTMLQIETAAGDTTIGHALAYCQAIEALCGIKVPARAAYIRGIALELERLANHTGDLGALAGDVGYLPTLSYCGRIRGDFLNMTALVCGSRLGRALVRPGGVAFDLDASRIADLSARLDRAAEDFHVATDLLWQNALVMARFENTGTVSLEATRDLGIVGPAARASGSPNDIRRDFPTAPYTQLPPEVQTRESGDVLARAQVRAMEARESIALIRRMLESLPEGDCRAAATPAALPGGKMVVSLVEGWRGSICHVAITGETGRFAHYKIIDPSFHNWTALAMALRGQQISDFPLCNKSFNLSYCGYDL